MISNKTQLLVTFLLLWGTAAIADEAIWVGSMALDPDSLSGPAKAAQATMSKLCGSYPTNRVPESDLKRGANTQPRLRRMYALNRSTDPGSRKSEGISGSAALPLRDKSREECQQAQIAATVVENLQPANTETTVSYAPTEYVLRCVHADSSITKTTTPTNTGNSTVQQTTYVPDVNIPAPEIDSPLTGIQLSTVVPASSDGNMTLPENRARFLNASYGSRMDSTPSGHGYCPDRNPYPIRYNPLYFEDPNLERCGNANGCLTEPISILHFAGRIPLLPYLATAQHPRSCVKALPDCPTCHAFGPDAYIPNPLELDLSGAAVEGAVAVGLVFLIP